MNAYPAAHFNPSSATQPGPRAGLPATIDTLTDVIERLGERADEPAIVAMAATGSRTLARGELQREVWKLAAALARRLARGDTVGLLGPDSPEWIIAALAAVRAGAVAMPLDAQLSDENLAHMLADSGARLVFTTTDRLPRVQRASPQCEVVLLDAPASDRRSLAAFTAAAGAGDPTLPSPAAADLAALFYTSGTTGRPKGVPLTHANLAFQVNTIAATGLIGPTDRAVLPLPLHHVYPFVIGVLLPVALAVPIVLPYALTGPQVVRAIKDGEATVMIGVPRLYAALFDAIESRVAARGARAAWLFTRLLALSVWARRRLGLHLGRHLFGRLHSVLAPRLRILASGGAALDPQLAWRLEGLGWRIGIGYGLTETAPILTLNVPPSPRLETAGRPVPGVELRIDALPGEIGEVQARGPNVFAGYRNLPEKTREAFTADGWFRTGDLGRLEDGWLVLTGRAKELIVTAGGENIQPEEVERAFCAQPFILDFALLEDGDRLVGLALPDAGAIARAGLADIDAAVRSAVDAVQPTLPSYQRVVEYQLVRDPLPRTRLGKLRRHELPRLYADARAGHLAAAGALAPERMAEADRLLVEDEAPCKVWDWLAGRYPDRRITPDASLGLDLGVDSLGWLELAMEVQRLSGAELTEEAITGIHTVRDLLRAIQAAPSAAQARDWDRPEHVLSPAELARLRPHRGALRALHHALIALNRALMRGAFRLKASGMERLPDSAFVLAPNHASYLDAFLVGAALPARVLDRTCWAGWAGIAHANAVMRFFSRIGRVLPVDPDRGAFGSLAVAAAALERGERLVWFPEGRRSATGALLPLRPGLGLLMSRFPRPIVPVHIEGSFAAWPVGRRWPRPHPVRVIFGEPLDPNALRGPDGAASAERITAAVAARLAAMAQVHHAD
ncbi:MAG: long-chain-fatty-acid--CoA ligase [Pseudomonadota bacterium]